MRLPLLIMLFMLLAIGTAPSGFGAPTSQSTGQSIFLPLVANGTKATQRVNAPYFETANITGEKFGEMAIFWFGRIDQTNNSTDVRVAYNDTALFIYTAIFDRRLWHTTQPTPATLTEWDAVTLYLSPGGLTGSAPDTAAYRFDVQLSGDSDPRYQAAYQGDGSGWVPAAIPFYTKPGWRGEKLNDDTDDRGWAMTYAIPFSSLGLSARPADGTPWGMALAVHDRDDAAGSLIPAQTWPPAMEGVVPATWATLSFGLPNFTPPPLSATQTITVRNRLNGVDVDDAMVGGGFTCGGGLDFWTEWGNAIYFRVPDGHQEERGDFNVQNQSDLADWPCFAKNYVTFPLDSLPQGRTVVSATLVLRQFGNADPQQAKPSLIQIMTVDQPWNETSLSWNNAPLAVENVSRAWVTPVQETPPNPIPYQWDVSRAVAQAYTNNTALQLALYSADSGYSSGKYFISSDTGDWNERNRPTLYVTLGTP